jgi:2-hydroxyacyl-CoA lyase 1
MAQVEAARPYSKFSARPSEIARIPYYVEKVCNYMWLMRKGGGHLLTGQAVRASLYGRPGVAYIDMPGDMITGSGNVSHAMYTFLCIAHLHIYHLL